MPLTLNYISYFIFVILLILVIKGRIMISIIIPIHNCEKYIYECLSSVKNQTFKDLEVILINDGSIDASRSICEDFIKEMPHFTLINQEKKGVSTARNIGLQHAKGEYIAFLDADDWIDDDMIEELYLLLIENSADISMINYVKEKNKTKTNSQLKKLKNDDDQKIMVYDKQEAISMLIINQDIQDYVWGKLYKKELFKDIYYPEETYYEDIFVMYKVFNNAEKFIKKNAVKLHYRHHENSITAKQTIFLKKELDYVHALINLYEFVIQNPEKISKKLNDDVYSHLAIRFFRAKKCSLKNFHQDKSSLQIFSKLINPILKDLVSKSKISKLGILRYIYAKTLLQVT